ncbi:MAG TPA: hypothetical protein DCG54_02415 [Anaerolineae bacterium]|jgi:hypothetical protein|nr:hypothetical protein [Anaerolineae bacterium]
MSIFGVIIIIILTMVLEYFVIIWFKKRRQREEQKKTQPILAEENETLKQRIDELEQALDKSLEWNLSASPSIKAGTLNWPKLLLFLVTIFASVIPVYFVIQERWNKNLISIRVIDEMWWAVPFFRELAFPRFFLIVFALLIVIWAIVLCWPVRAQLAFSKFNVGKTQEDAPLSDFKKKLWLGLIIAAFGIAVIGAVATLFIKERIPGWELLLALSLYLAGWAVKELSIAKIRDFLVTRGRLILDSVIFIIALSGALYAFWGSNNGPHLIFYLLFIIASINLVKHFRQIHPIFWISIISLVAMTWNIDAWEYVVIGDEYAFYKEIRNILENRTAWELVNATFNGTFVYGSHPYFSSYIHNLFMKLFDNQNFGWRFSNPVVVASSLSFFYYSFKHFIPRQHAFVVVIFLGFSHYLISFSKIGYNNLQALFGLGLILAVFTWALKSGRNVAFAFLGLAMGLCFYLYPAALYIVPLPIFGLLIFAPPVSKDRLKQWSWILVSMLLLIYPLFYQPQYWQEKLAGTLLHINFASAGQSPLANIINNFFYAFFSYLYTIEETHFVSTSFADPLSSTFIVFGMATLIGLAWKKNRSALFLGGSFLFFVVVVGASHGRQFPPTTRMFMLLPWYGLFCAYGIEWVMEKADSLYSINGRNILILILSSIVLVNLYQSYKVDIQRVDQYQGESALFIKLVREISATEDVSKKMYYFVENSSWNTDGLEIIQQVYGYPESPAQLKALYVDENGRLPENAQEIVSSNQSIILVKTNLNESLRANVDQQLQEWGLVSCQICNPNGVVYFDVWHTGELDWFCNK